MQCVALAGEPREAPGLLCGIGEPEESRRGMDAAAHPGEGRKVHGRMFATTNNRTGNGADLQAEGMNEQ